MVGMSDFSLMICWNFALLQFLQNKFVLQYMSIIVTHRSWSTSPLIQRLPSQILEHLSLVSISSHGIEPDRLRQKHEANEHYNSKSAYLQSLLAASIEQARWWLIWKFSGPLRFPLFLQHVRWCGLKTRELLASPRIGVDTTCPMCQQLIESDLHILRDCSDTVALWKLVLPP